MSDLMAYVTCVKSVGGGGGGEKRERGFCAFFPSPPLFCSCYVGLCLMRSYQQSKVMTAWTDQMHMLKDLHNILKDISESQFYVSQTTFLVCPTEMQGCC